MITQNGRLVRSRGAIGLCVGWEREGESEGDLYRAGELDWEPAERESEREYRSLLQSLQCMVFMKTAFL